MSDIVEAYEKWAGKMNESGNKQERDQWLQGLGCFKLGWNERDKELAALRAEREALKAENDKLWGVMVEAAMPYEALLIDRESRNWIAPEIWNMIEHFVQKARAALEQK